MILATRGAAGEVERRSFVLSDMARFGYDGLRYTPAQMGAKSVAGIPAINRAVRMRCEAIASLTLECCRGTGPDRMASDTTWQARLLSSPRYNEYQTRFAFWEAVEESMSYRGNAFIWRPPDPMTGRIPVMYALHPDQVAPVAGGWRVEMGGQYIDAVGKGVGIYEVDETAILHIRGHGEGGTRIAPSPIKVFRDALQGPMSRMLYENRVWQRGASLQLAVELPREMTVKDAEEWRRMWKQTYEGMDGDRTAVIGGGGTIKPVGMSFDDAQFVALAHLTVEDASRIMGVPAELLGAPLAKEAGPALEAYLAQWLRFGLGPELYRVECALAGDGYLFPDGSPYYPRFDTDDFVRGDVMTEANVMHLRIQDGTLLPDEARMELGYGPLPDGLGQIPQITPVGGAPAGVPAPGYKGAGPAQPAA